MLPTITITMVGPTGVGKTSLLAAMYGELEKELHSIGCSFSMDPGPTTKSINERLRELKDVATGNGMRVQSGEGIGRGVDKREYIFELDVGDGGEPEARLRFVDMPGGWYTAEGNYQEADKELGESQVSFLAVDAVALMEQPSQACNGLGKFHEKLNSPDYIKEAYKRALKHLRDDHVIIIALIRSETYVRNGKTKELMKKVKDAYGEMIGYLKINGNQIQAYACYVETIGSIVFHRFNLEENGDLASVEYRRVKDKGYSPSRCAVPLRIAAIRALGHAVDLAIEDFVKNNTFFGKVKDMLGFDKALTRAKDKAHKVYNAFEKIKDNINDDDYTQLH